MTSGTLSWHCHWCIERRNCLIWESSPGMWVSVPSCTVCFSSPVWWPCWCYLTEPDMVWITLLCSQVAWTWTFMTKLPVFLHIFCLEHNVKIRVVWPSLYEGQVLDLLTVFKNIAACIGVDPSSCETESKLFSQSLSLTVNVTLYFISYNTVSMLSWKVNKFEKC